MGTHTDLIPKFTGARLTIAADHFTTELLPDGPSTTLPTWSAHTAGWVRVREPSPEYVPPARHSRELSDARTLTIDMCDGRLQVARGTNGIYVPGDVNDPRLPSGWTLESDDGEKAVYTATLEPVQDMWAEMLTVPVYGPSEGRVATYSTNVASGDNRHAVHIAARGPWIVEALRDPEHIRQAPKWARLALLAALREFRAQAEEAEETVLLIARESGEQQASIAEVADALRVTKGAAQERLRNVTAAHARDTTLVRSKWRNEDQGAQFGNVVIGWCEVHQQPMCRQH